MILRVVFAGLCILTLLPLLSGCAERLVYATPPVELLADCPKPSPVIETNGALAQAYVLRGHAIDLCNADKAALRAWVKELPD